MLGPLQVEKREKNAAPPVLEGINIAQFRELVPMRSNRQS